MNLTCRKSIQFPPDVNQMIEEAAIRNNRSFSGEVVHRLRQDLKLAPTQKRIAKPRKPKK